MAAPVHEHNASESSASHPSSPNRNSDMEDTPRHVHFTEEDIHRKEGKEHNPEYHTTDTHMPQPRHVNFAPEDIERKKGKEHNPEYHIADTHVPQARHVNFSPQDVERKRGKEHKNYPKTNVVENPAKVKVSKEDFFLHLKMLAAIFCFLFSGFIYSSLSGSGKDEGGASKEEKKSIHDIIRENEQRELALVEPPYPQTDEQLIRRSYAVGDDHAYSLNAECNLFLADSSISGLGVFTTKAFEEGEVVFPAATAAVAALSSLSDGIELPLHSHLVLLKQHHIYGNVIQGSSQGDTSITSKRNIRVGEELFIKFEDLDENYREIYHNQLHIHDPTMEEYEMADEIVAETVAAIPTKIVYEGVKRKNYKQKIDDKRKRRIVPSVDAASILTLLKNTIARYDERLATLIPETTVEARSILEDNGEGKGTARFISNRRSVDWIRSNGLCLDGLYPGHITTTTSSTANIDTASKRVGAFATRDISEGDVITTAPLYAIKTTDTNMNMHCYDAPVDGISFCPLSFAALIQSGATTGEEDDKDKVCTSNDENEGCPSTNIANAKVKWSESNLLNRQLNDVTADELIQHPLTGMTLDVVATRPIAKGEEVIIPQSHNKLHYL